MPRTLQFIALVLLVAVIPAFAQVRGPVPPVPSGLESLTGQLALDGAAPVLRAGARTLRLASDNHEIEETLADRRNAGRRIRVDGKRKGDTFRIEAFYTIRDGRYYKLIYYCEVCSITSYKPGICDCCQGYTDPKEVPWEPEGIH